MADSDRPARLSDRLALTIPEAADAIGVSQRHLRSVLPQIPHLHVGRRVVIPVAALEEWLQQQAHAEQSQVGAAVEEVLKSFD